MWSVLAAAVDFIHALAMAAWFLGFPLLFVKRWRTARLGYAVYAVVFIVASQVSMLVLDECFLTSVARWCAQHDPTRTVSGQWFTERIAAAIFGMSPSHRLVSWISEALVLATAAAVLVAVLRAHRRDPRREPAAR